MRRLFLFSLFLSLFLFFISSNIYANDVISDIQPDQVKTDVVSQTESTSQTTITGEQIKNFDSKITVNKDGTIDVIENILYDFDSLQKHGIYRSIPYSKINQNGKKFLMSLDNFKVIDEQGNPYNFTQTDESDLIKLKVGDADKLITGLHTYVISYKVSGALTYFSDHDEFYWNVTGNEWTVPIVFVTSEVTIPASTGQSEIKTICYTGSLGSKEQNCSSNANQNVVTVKNNDILYSNQGLTLIVSFPKGIVAVLEPKEHISFWDTFLGKLVILVFILLALIWYIGLPLFIPIRWWLAGRDLSASSGQVQGEVTAWYDPPKTKTGRFLTPAETGALIDEHADIKDIYALVVDLARRGYMEIIEKKGKVFGLRKSFSLEKTKEADSKLTSYEKEFFTSIFSGRTTFELKNNKMFDIVESTKKNLYDQVVADGFFSKDPSSVRNSYYILAVLALFTGNIHLAIITFIFAGVMPRKTLLGAKQLAVAKSLKNFLSSQERQLQFQAKNQMFFEKLLPYAVAFGVEKVWADRFKDINLKSPDWYQGYSGSQFNSILLVSSLNSSFSRISSAATPTRSSSGFSSGFSGGGFSGSGGGGGGGGSW